MMPNDRQWLLQSRKKLSSFYGVDVKLPAIRYFYSRESVDEYWGWKTPSWLSGWTKNGRIHIVHPSVFKVVTCHTLSDYRRVLLHEYSHLFYNTLTHTSSPRWLNEGLASELAGQRKRRPTEREALSVGRYFTRGGSNVYHIGTFWVSVLLQEYGKKKFVMFLKSFSSRKLHSAIFRSLFFDIFGIHFTQKQLRLLYREYMRSRK